MEGIKEVERKNKRTGPPRGRRRGGQFDRTPIRTRLRSDAKRFSSVWKKASLSNRWPAKWAWA